MVEKVRFGELRIHKPKQEARMSRCRTLRNTDEFLLDMLVSLL